MQRFRPSRADIPVSIKKQFSSALTEMMTGAYAVAAVALVGVTSTTDSVAQFSSGDRTYRLTLVTVAALSNALTSWAIRPGTGIHWPRARLALRAHLIWGAIGGATFAVLAPSLSAGLYGEALRMDNEMAIAFGVAFFAVSVSSSLARHILLPQGRTRSVLTATSFGTIIGLPTILGAAAEWGAVGGAVGVATAEGAVTAVMVSIALLSTSTRQTKELTQ